MDSEASREDAALLNRLRAGLTDFEKDRTNLLPILRMIQETLSYIPEEAIHMTADHLDMAPSEIFGVATFYNQFKFNPPGKYPIKVCLGTACHVKGGDIILENFERKLRIR
ncbi:MAG: NAD(P)H-dependent oxidoreductase subunit E, partial [Thermodesulfobacteriota bacterium]